MEKEEAKQKLIELIEKHQRFKNEGRLKGINEENTKDWIDELFRILGWNYIDEVKKEYGTGKRKRVDYAFQINGTTKFLLEAKAYNEELKDEHIGQALQYGYSNNKTWVVLSNFREIRVYNAKYYDQPEHIRRLYEPLRIEDAIARFDDLWVLSEEGMKNNLINQLANKYGKIKPKEPITTLFFEDLMEWRKALEKAIKEHSRLNAIPADEEEAEKRISEAVQKILDRIIFIRVCEDRGLEEEGILEWCVKEWKANKKYSLMSYLSRQFQKKDAEYNSGLFARHYSEDLTIDNEVIEKIITETYHNSSGLSYDFSAMDADILGTVYENYLAYIQKKVWNKESKQKSKRKAQGIYYTPTYIVDYIVKNTLGEKLKECKTPEDALKIRVLDPACGSGSFLIRAYDEFKQWFAARNKGEQTKLNVDNEKGMQTFMDKVLENCIYGVDLDDKAVEITQLNLLLKAAEGKHKLPTLSHTIQCGNSLIDDPAVAGDKAFKWEERFPEVFRNGGFDVVVGNPPWGQKSIKFSEQEKELFRMVYPDAMTGQIDICRFFIEKAIHIASKSGFFAFVLPDIILLKNYDRTRKFMLDELDLTKIDYWGMAFADVNLDSCTIIGTKETGKKSNNVHCTVHENEGNFENDVPQRTFVSLEGHKFNLYINETKLELINKLTKNGVFGDFFEPHEGIHSGNIRNKLFVDKKEDTHSKKLIFGRDEIRRYVVTWNGKWVNYNPVIIKKADGEYAGLGKPEYFENEKIIVRRTGDFILAALDAEGYYFSNNFFVCLPRKESIIELKYALALLNSKMGTWFYRAVQPRKGKLFAELKINVLKQLPLKKSPPETQETFADLVKRIIVLQNRALDLKNLDSNEAQRLKTEIEKTDAEIDQLVYKLYGLTEDEIKIVEEAVK